MDGRWGAGTECVPGGPASEEITAMAAALRRHAGKLADIRRHALSVALLSWDSPAGGNFRTYLSERCTELSGSISLLESAAQDLGDYGHLVREAEALHRAVGL
ncbi:hypothetical protein RCH21_003296 [Arthrobacter sp. PL16]|uniref:hypothetical protein n=1 Tax=Arthrobacter sp. PL16 TaxID=3071720 RepID=UPI002E083278|nr:hypothetical protein [Arthrobacter sp. PL16]